MRYAILSDIHSNLAALEAVLKRLERERVDGFICLGDVVGYCASPNECCEHIRELNAVVVRGNHDLAAVTPGTEEWFTPAARKCILWTREQLTADNRDFLHALPPLAELAGAHLCHGAVFDPDFYTTTPHEALLSFAAMVLPVAFFGHTHYAEWFTQNGPGHMPAQHRMPEGGLLTIEQGRRYLVNPGAVGQPRDGNSQAGYAVWDTEAGAVALCRVPYNIHDTQQRMEEAGLPWSMSARLVMGT